MATIEKRGKNSWRVGHQVIRDDGSRKWIRRTLSFPPHMTDAQQRHAAEVALARLIVAIEDGSADPQKQHTLRDLAELWMKNHVIPNCEPDTVKTYRNFLDKRILPDIGGTRLDQLTPLAMSSYLARLRTEPVTLHRLPDEKLKRPRTPSDRARMTQNEGKTLSARTVRHYHDTLSSMCKQAVKWELMYKNPMEGVQRPKVRKKAVKALDDDQAVQLLRCLKTEKNMSFRAAVLLALTCGLRLGEVGALNLSDIDWKNGSIDIRQARHYTPDLGSYDDTTKTERSDRMIDLPPAMLTLLDETRKYQEEVAAIVGDVWQGDGRIVCGWNGLPYHHDTPSKQWQTFARKHGFNGVRFHDLRHSHATLLFASNIDAVAVASRLGHTDASTTLRTYAHALRRRDRDSANVMQSLIDRADDDNQ